MSVKLMLCLLNLAAVCPLQAPATAARASAPGMLDQITTGSGYGCLQAEVVGTTPPPDEPAATTPLDDDDNACASAAAPKRRFRRKRRRSRVANRAASPSKPQVSIDAGIAKKGTERKATRSTTARKSGRSLSDSGEPAPVSIIAAA